MSHEQVASHYCGAHRSQATGCRGRVAACDRGVARQRDPDRVFGSLARGDFRDHSDIDFLVSGPVDQHVRVAVETTVARELGGTELPYDIIYLDDLTPEQAVIFARG